MSRRVALIGALCALILVSACRTLPSAAPANTPDAATLLAQQQAYTRAVKSVEADANLEIVMPERHDRVDLILIAKKPDSALFELTGPTGLIAIATLSGSEFRLFEAGRKRGVHGPVTPYSMAQVMPWVVMPSQLVPLLCATPPLLDVEPEPVRWDAERKRWLVVLRKAESGLLQKLWFDNDGHLLAMQLLTVRKGQERLNIDATFLKWRGGADGTPAFPQFIRLAHPDSKTELTIRLHGDALLNGAYQPETFQLVFPEGVPVEYIPGSAHEAAPPDDDEIRGLLPD